MFKYLEDFVGHTPLVRLKRMPGNTSNIILVKLEGNNPAGSVKDRPALSMIRHAALRGDIRTGDTLIEATSGNTGIALAMAAAVMGYRMILIMPKSASIERVQSMKAYGAEVILEDSMESARDLAQTMVNQGQGRVLDQFANTDNPLAHYESTGPEIWQDTDGRITHFVSSMGTTGTIMGTGRYLKQQSAAVQIIGVQPCDGAQIPGIRKWPADYVPGICDFSQLDRVMEVNQALAEETTRRLAREEGIFAGISSGGALAAALQLSEEIENAVIVSIVCDRGDRYLSTGVFPA